MFRRYDFEIYLKYLVLELYKESGTISIGVCRGFFITLPKTTAIVSITPKTGA